MKRKFIALTVVVLCALAAWDGTAWAQNCTGRTKRVPQDCRTIQMAVDRASAGDIILIRPGTYRENVEIRNKRRLTFEAERATDNRAVIVQGRAAGTDPIFQIDNSDDITFENAFVFQNGTAGLLINNSERVQLTHSQNAHLIIQDNEQSGIVMSGGSLSGEFVIVQNNGTDGAGLGIELSGSAQFQLANTQILKNPSGGVIVTTGASVQLDQSEIIDSLGPGVYAKEGSVQLTDTL
ncbi:MAG TPA: right-handed parallel beta-helix repeat-containing protein, partial [Candidatus Bipolaricaulota bacterium]